MFNNYNILKIALALLMLIALNGCKSNKKNEDNVKKDLVNQVKDTSTSRIVKLNNTLFSVPSPYQAAIFISNQKIPYNREILNDAGQTSKYNSTFFRAANLGVYGADMAYVTLYEQSPDAMKYFSVIKGLAEDLELLGAFNKSTIQRIENNIGNQDSLLRILGNTYRDADVFFKDNQQEHLACLVIAGGWVESVYLLANLSKNDSKELITRIGENKKPLNNLVELLAPYSDRNQQYKKLVESLIDLATIYEKVEVNYKFRKTETDPETNLTRVYSESIVNMNPATLKEIKVSLSNIRNFIIKR